eukprot:GHUV01002458.1.p1 GENE.GHUV01002458.1~~GHUV01002458.1.p1  ORF type:complete len:103 (+),score=13.37 GHUV01002458.1:295-603(+)
MLCGQAKLQCHHGKTINETAQRSQRLHSRVNTDVMGHCIVVCSNALYCGQHCVVLSNADCSNPVKGCIDNALYAATVGSRTRVVLQHKQKATRRISKLATCL